MKTNNQQTPDALKALSLQSDIQQAAATLLPRREPILDWLKAFLSRAGQKGYILGETEADDLNSLEAFLREYGVPVAAKAAI
jgi:hypothetical protein